MKRIPVIVFGAGGVGSALLRQIMDGRERVAARNQCRFDVVAVTDSQSCLFAAAGLDDAALLAAVERKQQGMVVAEGARPSEIEIIDQVRQAGWEKGIVVDVTAVGGMEPVLDHALASGYGVTLANKKALAGPWQTAQKYFNHPRVRHESTVGGGQPVIATLRYLLDVNDPIYRIEGQMSGTLGFICGQMDGGVLFSRAVREAKEMGYTEPDPREDLSGKDVMRKVMILARMAGWPLEEVDIEVESLYTPELADLSVPDFLEAVATLDETMRLRVATAQMEGMALRYVAEVENGRGIVGLKAVPAGSALSSLKYISFRTGRYDDEPLLIGGKGAGVEMTAAGVLGDMIDLAREAL
ncbi:MAG: homoserine dehydrogenase [Chloroflexi bacterium]|nr:homoserine dehydrogenase [Chloroflexota bacterium]